METEFLGPAQKRRTKAGRSKTEVLQRKNQFSFSNFHFSTIPKFHYSNNPSPQFSITIHF